MYFEPFIPHPFHVNTKNVNLPLWKKAHRIVKTKLENSNLLSVLCVTKWLILSKSAWNQYLFYLSRPIGYFSISASKHFNVITFWFVFSNLNLRKTAENIKNIKKCRKHKKACSKIVVEFPNAMQWTVHCIKIWKISCPNLISYEFFPSR